MPMMVIEAPEAIATIAMGKGSGAVLGGVAVGEGEGLGDGEGDGMAPLYPKGAYCMVNE